MSLDQIIRDTYNDPAYMKHLDLINSEGTILRVEKVWERCYFNFKHDKFRIEITRPEIYKFLSGELIISDPQGETYNIKNYSEGCIVYKQEDLDELLK